VQALTLAGRKRDAEKLFKKLLRLKNDAGLLSEKYDIRACELTGNFLQALSHIVLVNAAFHLDPQPEHQMRGRQDWAGDPVDRTYLTGGFFLRHLGAGFSGFR
jgi:hypothetical protein